MLHEINEQHIPYYRTLEEIRKSGVTNMWGAAPYLYQKCKELTLEQAGDILVEWIENYDILNEQIFKKDRDKHIEELWNRFADVPMNPETEKMEEQFLHFPAGTDREEIWHWFDLRYSRGVAALLYGEK